MFLLRDVRSLKTLHCRLSHNTRYIAFASPGLGWRYSTTDWITLLALSVSYQPLLRATLGPLLQNTADRKYLTFGAQIVETIAVQRVSGMQAALIGYSQVRLLSRRSCCPCSPQIVFAAIVQFIFTSTLPSSLAVFGRAIIVVAGVWCIVSVSNKLRWDPTEATQLEGSAPAKDNGNTPASYELVPQAEVERCPTSNLVDVTVSRIDDL